MFGRVVDVVIDVVEAEPLGRVTMVIGELAEVVPDDANEEVVLSVATYGNGSDADVACMGSNTWIALDLDE